MIPRQGQARSLRVAAFAVVLGACAPASPPAATTPPAPTASPEPVDGATAKRLVHDGARLVDVRTPEEYRAAHVEGAVNVPVDVIGERDLDPKSAPIVVYCASGKRSARAAATLRSKGYARVFDLGAMSNWGD